MKDRATGGPTDSARYRRLIDFIVAELVRDIEDEAKQSPETQEPATGGEAPRMYGDGEVS